MRIRTAFILLLLCLFLGTAAQAAALPIYFTDALSDEIAGCDMIINRLELVEIDGRHHLFLPAGWDASALRVHITDDASYVAVCDGLDSLELTDGLVTDLFSPSSKIYLKKGKKTVGSIRVMQGSLPAVFIQTQSNSVTSLTASKENVESGSFHMVDAQGNTIHTGELSAVRLHGNSTRLYSKKPFQFKLKHKAELIENAGEARTWVLLADYIDLSLLRNRITLDIAEYVGLPYSVASRHVDLYINGRYMGTDLLTEKVQVNANRVDIMERNDEMISLNGDQELSDLPFTIKRKDRDNIYYAGFEIPVDVDDLSGGYLLEIDKLHRVLEERDHGFIITQRGLGMLISSPSAASLAQAEYVYNYINAFERAIATNDGCDPETGKHYSELADVDSFALKYILEDLSGNFDAKAGSQFYYKDSEMFGGKLYAGPAWDYDLTYAAVDPIKATDAYLTLKKFSGSWWYLFYSHQSAFRQRVSELYLERYIPALEVLLGLREPTAGMRLHNFDDYASEIQESATMNFTRYQKAKQYNREAGRSHDAAVTLLKSFLSKRMSALQTHYEENAQ